MKNYKNYYQDFWKAQDSPLHRDNSAMTLAQYGKELRNLLDHLEFPAGYVLEFGCANGGLFHELDFEPSNYTGIDLSASMLQQFKNSVPGVEVSLGNLEDFRFEKSYSLIFSNAVLQHTPKATIQEHLPKALSHISVGGVYFVGNLPLRALIWHYYRGPFQPSLKTSCMQKVRNTLRCIITLMTKRSKGIGFWHSISTFRDIAGTDFDLKVFGSNFYPYRAHLAIKRIR